MSSRRSFLKQSGLLSAAVGMNVLPFSLSDSPRSDSLPMVGVQIAPHSLLDEGIEYALDLLRENAEVNTLFLNVYGYYGGMGRSAAMMGDHGKPKRDAADRNFPISWIRHDRKLFDASGLYHPEPDSALEYGDIDIIEMIQGPLRKRDMKLYIRLYEGFGTQRHVSIAGWAEKTNSTDLFGNEHHLPCFNKTAFRNWWVATIQNLCRRYDIDGIQYGAERGSILHHTIWRNTEPTCFCEDCIRRGRENNIDHERARRGYQTLWEYMRRLGGDDHRPADGVWVELFRILLDYPEILAWEKQDHLAREELTRQMYQAAKSIRPDIQFGAHISLASQAKSLIDRAQEDYEKMTGFNDFFKLIVYHEIGGVRNHRNATRIHQTLLKEFSEPEAYRIFMGLHGLDTEKQPAIDQIQQEGFHLEYVYKEVERCAIKVRPHAKVYAGIGFDIPKGKNWGNQRWESDPEKIREAVYMAHKAGADGFVASREYEEMSLTSLKAFGSAIREISR